jgi:DNA-binding SARP family transcriptional activator
MWIGPVLVLGVSGGVGLVVLRRRSAGRGSYHRQATAAPESKPAVHAAPEPPVDVAGRVDLAFRHAWAAFRRSGCDARPSVLAVRVGDLGVELLLDEAWPDAPDRFVASAGGHEWALGADVDTAELQASAADEPAPLPALVSVGVTPEGPVLIDLISAGTLSVEGDAGAVATFLAGAALELASAPWAVDLAVGLIGGDQRVAALGSAEVLAAPAAAEIEDLVEEWLKATPKVAAIVVDAQWAEATAGIAAVVGSSPGRAGLLAAGPVPDATWRLVVGAGGEAVLQPLGLELSCPVDPAAVEHVVAALSARTTPGPVADVAPDGGTARVPEQLGVAVLGPVVVRWPAVGGRRQPTRRRVEEVVAYLATHPERPVPAERLRSAIWPLSDDERAGDVADSSFRGTMSRTRVALGAAPDGRPWLPESRDGCYQLDPAFGCDWVRFTGLLRRSASAATPEAAELLREALALVRGAPFADSPKGSYGWAWDEQLVSAIEVAVADAAERLAELALGAGDHATARWAAGRGLLVVPTRESLYRARMRAAFEAGDADDVEQAYTEARRAARGLDGSGPQAETTALYERLRRASRPAAVEPDSHAERHLTAVP